MQRKELERNNRRFRKAVTQPIVDAGFSGGTGPAGPQGPPGIGGAFLDVTEFDDTDATYYFYGGVDLSLDWKINRYNKNTFVKTSADEAGNPTKTSLALAWTDRLTLTYA